MLAVLKRCRREVAHPDRTKRLKVANDVKERHGHIVRCEKEE